VFDITDKVIVGFQLLRDDANTQQTDLAKASSYSPILYVGLFIHIIFVVALFCQEHKKNVSVHYK